MRVWFAELRIIGFAELNDSQPVINWFDWLSTLLTDWYNKTIAWKPSFSWLENSHQNISFCRRIVWYMNFLKYYQVPIIFISYFSSPSGHLNNFLQVNFDDSFLLFFLLLAATSYISSRFVAEYSRLFNCN